MQRRIADSMFITATVLFLAACSGGSGGSSTSADTTGSGLASIAPGSSSSASSIASSTASSSVASAASSSAAFDTSIVWTSVAPAPGQATAISPDNTIAANTVLTFGQVFPAGEIPAGQSVQATASGTALATQTDVKRRYADGSVRHAILSVRLPATTVGASAKASVSMSLAATGSSPAGTSVTLASVNGSGSPVDYRVEIYEHGLKASGAATDESGKTWTTTLKNALTGSVSQWISGPVATEWRARVAPVSAGSPHPGLRVVFDARYQSASQGRLSITLENVESSAARGDRTYDIRIYDATTGGTVLFSQNNVVHYAHTRYRKVYYFGTGMKDIMGIADVARLKNARAIPNYANITIPESALSSNYLSWQLSNRGLYQPALIMAGMTTTGGRTDIGPLPGWTARALISGDPRMYQIMLDHADRAGMWSVHWRDSLKSGATAATADIFSINDHPNFSLFNTSYAADSYVGSAHYNWHGDALPAPTLTFSTPAGWQQDDAHEPSLAYLPYIVTGDHYYLDELYFYAGWHLIHYGYDYRGYDKGWYTGSVTREMAWKLRTAGHAAWIAPDTDWQKSYFTDKLENSFTWYRANVMTTNTLGYWTGWSGFASYELPYSPGGVTQVVSPWQHQFMAYTLFELCEKGYAATDLRDFALGFSVKLFTSGSAFDRMDGSTYRLPAQLTGGATLTSMAQLNTYAFGGVSFAARNPSAPTNLPEYSSTGGAAIFGLATLAAAIDTAGSDTSLPSSGYVFVRDEIMRHGNSNRQQFMADPTWNIVPRASVVGLSEAPGIYTK